jgi:hypothetical protein
MADGKRSLQTKETLGDAAVDGLLAGGGAGILMAVYLWIAGLTLGISAGAMFSRFDPGGTASPVSGLLIHLAVSGVYGAIYGLGRRLTAGWPALARLPGWLAGGLYGAILLALAWTVILPGTASPVREIPLVHLAAAHGVYGLVLGRLGAAQRR